MASVHQTKSGRTVVQFYNRRGERKTLSLGRWPVKAAEKVAERVEAIVASQISGEPLDLDTARWLGDVEDWMHGKLADAGVVTPRSEQSVPDKLGAFVARYIDGRTDVKGETLKTYRRAERHLVAHFGADRPLRGITPADAEDFRIYLKGQPGKQRETMAEATIRKTCQIAQQFFENARKRRLIRENPFEAVPTTNRRDDSREFFVSRELAESVLKALPDAEWKLLFALSRYGGLRCPSEVMRLTWADVDWDRGRMTVHSSKTEHHEGKEKRVIPIFAELRPHLDAAWFALGERVAHFVISEHRSKNPATQLRRYLKLAEIEPWPKLFHNLRASRETELADEFPIQTVCAWIGHGRDVAKRHYLQVTDEHFERAAGLQRAAHALHDDAKQCEPEEPTETAESEKPRKKRGDAGSCETLRTASVGVTGPQLPRSGSTQPMGGASVVDDGETGDRRRAAQLEGLAAHQLGQVVEAWPHLDARARRRILRIVDRERRDG